MDDPELASEMLKLLRDELERVRADIEEARHGDRQSGLPWMVRPEEMHALQEENARLKQELEVARAKISQLPSHDVVQDTWQGSERATSHSGSLAEDRARKVRVLADEADRLTRKITVSRDKYTKKKACKTQLYESLAEAEQRLTDTKRMREKEATGLAELQKELLDMRMAREFDPLRFIRDSQPVLSDKVPSHAEVLLSTGLAFQLSSSLLNLCVPGGYISKSQEEIAWSEDSDSRSRCISFSSTHRFNPKLNGTGGWESPWDLQTQGEIRDFFYCTDRKWYYIGTYQYVGQATFASKDIGKLVRPHMHYIRKRAVIFPNLVPPILTGIVKNMLDYGVLKIACTGWRRVSFNNRLAEALRSEGRPSSTTAGNKQADSNKVLPRGSVKGAKDTSAKSKKRQRADAQVGPRKKPKSR